MYYLDSDYSFTGVYKCEKSSNSILQMCAVLCMLVIHIHPYKIIHVERIETENMYVWKRTERKEEMKKEQEKEEEYWLPHWLSLQVMYVWTLKYT